MTALDRGSLLAFAASWSACVRDADYETAQAMFAPEVLAFGTRNARLEGRDELLQRQWRPVWDTTEGFTIDPGSVACWTQGELAVLAGTWASRTRPDDDGTARERTGRVTLVLRAGPDGPVAVHSHLSMDPGVAP